MKPGSPTAAVEDAHPWPKIRQQEAEVAGDSAARHDFDDPRAVAVGIDLACGVGIRLA
jgi:hypothetical protein